MRHLVSWLQDKFCCVLDCCCFRRLRRICDFWKRFCSYLTAVMQNHCKLGHQSVNTLIAHQAPPPHSHINVSSLKMNMHISRFGGNLQGYNNQVQITPRVYHEATVVMFYIHAFDRVVITLQTFFCIQSLGVLLLTK